MKKLAALASMAVLLCASASFAKKAMDEEEMDVVTAAGQPAVIVVDGSGAATTGNTINIVADEMGTFTQTLDEMGQNTLRALALNNVAGENQVANGVNIRSGLGTEGALASQTNEINQSWGATFDWSAVEGTATVSAAMGGAGPSISGTIGDVKLTCVAIGQGCEAAATGLDLSGGDGGSAEAVLPTVRLSAYADKIIGVTDLGAANTVNVSQMNAATFTQVITDNAQSNLAALAINNVLGLNQVANGVNLASAGATVIGNQAGIPLVVADAVQQGRAVYDGTQSNVINQYRGTPLTRPDALPLLPVAP